MAITVSSTVTNDQVLLSWGQGSCSTLSYYTLTVYEGVFPSTTVYFTINQTQDSYTLNTVPNGDYYATVEAYDSGLSLCDSGNSGTITVNYAPPVSYTITVVKDPTAGGTTDVNGSSLSSVSVEETTTVNISATIASGYSFVSWEIDSVVVSTSVSYSFTMPSNDITLTATFLATPPPSEELRITFDDIANADLLVGDASNVADWNTFFNLPTNGNPYTSVQLFGNVVILTGGSNVTLSNNSLSVFGLFSANSNILEIYDEGTVSTIDIGTFYSCPLLTSVVFLTATLAKTSSFENCPSLTTANLPSLITAEDYCFAECTSLSSLTLTSLVTALEYCFYVCESLVTVNLPQTTTIGYSCFDSCYDLTTINLPVCQDLGGSVGNDGVFSGIFGQTITITVPQALLVCNGGNPDGDIQALKANNTVTILTPIPPNARQAYIYDTSCPKFYFVKNMSDRYFTGDTVDLTDYDYTDLLDEPINFDTGKFKLQRDETYHGFNYEFAVDSLSYEIGSVGYDYLRGQLYADGVDVDVKFVYGFGDVSSLTIFYIGKVDFNEYREIENGDLVEFSLRELDFDNLLQTAFEIEQTTEPTIDVLLYSKVIPKKVIYTVPKRNEVEKAGVESTYPSAFINEGIGTPLTQDSGILYLFINDGKEGDNDVDIFPSYDFQIDNNYPLTEGAGYKYLFRAKLAGTYTIKVKALLRLEFNDTSGASGFDFVTLKLVKTKNDGETIIGSTITSNPTIINTPLTDGYADCLYDYQTTLNIEFDQCVYLYFQILSSSIGTAELYNVGLRPFPEDSNQPQIEIIIQTVAPASKSKFIQPLELLESSISQSADTDYTTVVSDFFNVGGCGNKLVITNGFNIRGEELTERTYIKTSSKKIVENLTKLFCLGWGVEYNNIKQEVVRIEPVEYFYQDNEILLLDNISDYKKEVDSSKYYNEIEIGFSKYSKNRETDKGNTLDDFHTKHIYQTPIKTNKNKLSVITDLTLSGYEIEILRRKQFDKDGKSENANFKEDEDLFGVQLLDYTLFDGATYTGLLTDLSSGDIININTSSIIVVGLAYFYAGQKVNVNVDSQGIKETNIDSIQYGYFTPIGFGFSVLGTLIKFSSFIDSDINPLSPTVVIDTIDESYYVPESNQPFSTVSNLISPQSGYNIRYTPKRMLYNWAKIFNGGFFGKENTDQIVFKQGDGNVDLITNFLSEETCLLGDIDNEEIIEKSSVNIGNIYNRGFIHLPIKVSFSTSLSFEQLTTLKNCLRGNSEANNYGYVTITNPCGEEEKIFITSVEYSGVEEEATIEGYLKEL